MNNKWLEQKKGDFSIMTENQESNTIFELKKGNLPTLSMN